MQLVTPLIAGIRGAENGTAELYQRGSAATRATYYTMPEGRNAIATGDDVALDENGGATIYVNEAVDVVVRGSDGEVVRRFTMEMASAAVEVRSQSFTGAHFQSGASGAGSDYPLMLSAVLDLWKDQNGDLDWKVKVGSTSKKLPAWLAGLSGLVFNVMEYGAVGDGTTDDTAAFTAALTAANSAGGIVFVPGGSYRITSALSLGSSTSMLGAGAAGTVLLIDHATANLINVGAGVYPRQIQGVRLDAAQTNTGNLLSFNAASGLVMVSDCTIGDGSQTTGNLVAIASGSSYIRFRDTAFLPGGNASSVAMAGTALRVQCERCLFQTPASHSPTNGVVYGRRVDLRDCVFNTAFSTSGTFSCYKANDAGLDASVIGCQFGSSGGATVTAMELGTYSSASRFHESANVFGSSGITAYDYTVTGAARGSHVELVTRETRRFEVTNNDASYVAPVTQYGQITVIRSTNTDQTITEDDNIPEGATCKIFVLNDSGNAISEETLSFDSAGVAEGMADQTALFIHIFGYMLTAIGSDAFAFMNFQNAKIES